MAEKDNPITPFVALIDITEDKQIQELEEYLNAKGIAVEVGGEGESQVRIRSIVEKCQSIFADPSTSYQELEGLLYCIASLLHCVEERTSDMLREVCQLVGVNVSRENVNSRLKLLGILFCQFEPKDIMALVVLKQQLIFAEKHKVGHLLTISLPTLKKCMDNWKLSGDDRRSVLLLFWNAVKSTANKSICMEILIEILSLSNSASKDGASELATELIVLALNEPSNYFFNNILRLDAVKDLQSKNKNIYELLTLFVEEKVSSFSSFCTTNKQFINELGLSYDVCKRKMQLLTLLSLAVQFQEVPFSTMTDELQLEMLEVEQLVIDAIREQLLKARIDHVNRKLVVMSCVHRTFGQSQWQLIYDRLLSWKENISALQANMKTLQETSA